MKVGASLQTPRRRQKIQEVTGSLAAAEENSVDAKEVAVLSEVDGIFT